MSAERVPDLYTNRRPAGAFIVARSGFQGCRIGFGYLNCIGIDVGAHGFCRGVINQHLLIPTRARGGPARCRWTTCKKHRRNRRKYITPDWVSSLTELECSRMCSPSSRGAREVKSLHVTDKIQSAPSNFLNELSIHRDLSINSILIVELIGRSVANRIIVVDLK